MWTKWQHTFIPQYNYWFLTSRLMSIEWYSFCVVFVLEFGYRGWRWINYQDSRFNRRWRLRLLRKTLNFVSRTRAKRSFMRHYWGRRLFFCYRWLLTCGRQWTTFYALINGLLFNYLLCLSNSNIKSILELLILLR